MEKYITFSVPINKNCDDGKKIILRLTFVASFTFMNVSLSDLADDLSGRISNNIVCRKCMEREKNNSKCCFVGLKTDKLIYRCRKCKEEWERSIKTLIRKFLSIYQFCNGDLNIFILLLRKGVYPYEDMDNWENLMKPQYYLKKIFTAN